MQVQDLYSFSLWFQKNIIEVNFQGILTTVLNNTKKLASSTNSASATLYNEKKKILADNLSFIHANLEKMDLKTVSQDGMDIIKRMNLDTVILLQNFDAYENILRPDAALDTTIHILQLKIQTVQKASSVLKPFVTHLPLIENLAESAPSYHEKMLTRIRFNKEASINNVVDLDDWSGSWQKIALGYSIALNQTPQDFEIVSASRGSIIFDLLLNLETVQMLSDTFKNFSEAALNVGELILIINGLRNQTNVPGHEQVMKHLQEQLESQQEELASDIADKLLDKYHKGEEHSRNDAHGKLKRGIRELHKFVEKGGEVKVIDTIGTEESEETALIVEQALKQLENNSKQNFLPPPKDDD